MGLFRFSITSQAGFKLYFSIYLRFDIYWHMVVRKILFIMFVGSEVMLPFVFLIVVICAIAFYLITLTRGLSTLLVSFISLFK